MSGDEELSQGSIFQSMLRCDTDCGCCDGQCGSKSFLSDVPYFKEIKEDEQGTIHDERQLTLFERIDMLEQEVRMLRQELKASKDKKEGSFY